MSKQTKRRQVKPSELLTEEVIGALADKFGKKYPTMKRWIDAGDDRITSDKAKEVFEEKKVRWPLS